MNYFAKLGFNVLLLLCIPLAIDGLDTCVKTGPCKCVFPNGTGIDLMPAAESTFYTAQMYEMQVDKKEMKLSTYYYHPCYDALPPVNTSNAEDTCNQTLSICRYIYTLKLNDTTNTYKLDGGVANYMGKTNDSTFSANGDAIVYTNGPSKTTVLLVCAETDDELNVNSLAEPKDIILSFYSRSACLKTLETPDTGRSFGSTLLIIFFSVAIFYLVLGICTKKFLMGATGIEVIPNLAFWSDLPNLVKDGWAFAIAGFKLPVRGSGPAMSPDPNSYDSI